NVIGERGKYLPQIASIPFATENTEVTERERIVMGDPVTEKIIGAAIEVHRLLGPGLLESIYEEALCVEMQLRQISFRRQVEVDVNYKNHFIKGQRIDLLVEEEVIVELKSVINLPNIAAAQALSYLKATGLRRALLINFGANRLTDAIKRISLCSLWQRRN